jgi:ABC-type multidrug transport system fused ATPase/permease subunit
VAVSFSFVASSYTELVTSLGASERIFEVLDSHTPQPSASKTPITQLGNIQFNQVHFAYPSRPENVVLQGLQFEIPKAKVTALVGQSGSGKSTIVQLLMQLYSPTKGHISFDGQEAASFSSQSIRDRIALVPQDQILFSTSIKENLLYAKIDASQIELEQACAQAQILDFIRSLTLGFDTLVGERGVQLSTGQRQRLAIARAILKSPELLILDEATSALDVENEFLIQKAIEPLLKRCTVLVIAHRLSTIRSAQQVIVLESGKVVEIGSHDELMKGSGLYRNLVERQSERKVDCA